jgi:hypothetical protein
MILGIAVSYALMHRYSAFLITRSTSYHTVPVVIILGTPLQFWRPFEYNE